MELTISGRAARPTVGSHCALDFWFGELAL